MWNLRFSVILFSIAIAAIGAPGRQESNNEIAAFNEKFRQLIAGADHPGMLALWANDGVDLMPGEAPLIGKDAIGEWLKQIEASSPGSKVLREELQFYSIRRSGDWASEWATEHQIVQPRGKPAIEGYGKMALMLHRDSHGAWKIQQEMWNDSPKP